MLWIQFSVPHQRYQDCGFAFAFDYGLGFMGSSTEAFRLQITQRCHGRSIADVSREFDLPYTTVERWFYLHATDDLVEKSAQRICLDEFTLRKEHNYATSVLNADTGRILAIVPHRDDGAITAVLQKSNG